jgi:hypothetical protein
VAAPNRVMRQKRATLKRLPSRKAYRVLKDGRCQCGQRAIITFNKPGGVPIRRCADHL